MTRKLTDLQSLGDAWAEKTKGAEELAAWRKIQDANARRLLRKWDERERALEPGTICPCGKRSYPSKREALIAIDVREVDLSPYACPLGHPVYHLKAKQSTRQSGPR